MYSIFTDAAGSTSSEAKLGFTPTRMRGPKQQSPPSDVFQGHSSITGPYGSLEHQNSNPFTQAAIPSLLKASQIPITSSYTFGGMLGDPVRWRFRSSFARWRCLRPLGEPWDFRVTRFQFGQCTRLRLAGLGRYRPEPFRSSPDEPRPCQPAQVSFHSTDPSALSAS